MHSSTRGAVSRRVIATLTSAAIAGALIGCASSPESSALTGGAVPDDETTLTVWSFLPSNYDGGAEAYAELIDRFEERYPQVTVDLVDQPYPTYFDQLRNASVARKGPDVVTMYGAAQAFSFKNALFPLQDALDPEVLDALRFVPETYSKDGNLYVAPVGTYGYTMMANDELLAANGVDPAQALSSWDALLDTCTTLADAGVQPIATGWKDGILLETYLYMFTAQLMDETELSTWIDGTMQIDDPLFAEAVDATLEMRDAGCFGGDASLGRTMYTDSFDQFDTGAAAFGIGSTSDQVVRAEGVLPAVSVHAFPQLPGSHYEQLIDAGPEAGWGVTRWTKSPEAAVAFVEFLASEEAQMVLWEQTRVVPNVEGFAEPAGTPAQQQFVDLIQMPENHTGFAAFPVPVLASLERNAVPLMAGDLSTEELLAKAATASRAG